MISKSILNIIFRGLTLISKFAFVFFLGKYSIDEYDLGEFGIITTSISLIIYLIGFDYYVYNTREIIKSKNVISNVRNQFYFHLLLYVLLLPIALAVIFGFDFVGFKYFWIFLLLIFSEHLGQELFRLFTTLEKSAIANMLFFIKSGLWVWVALFDYFILKNEIDLTRYIIMWAIFSWGSMLLSVIYLKRTIAIKAFKFYKPNYSLIIMGAKNSGIFFISSMSFLIIQFSDRYMIDFYHGKKMVGVYSMYSQFINAIDVFVFSAIIMVMYPRLIKLFSVKEEYKKLYKKFITYVLCAAALLILMSWLIAPFIFEFLEKPSFLEYLETYNLLLLGVFFLLWSYVYHYDLYIKKKDVLLLKISLIAMVTNVTLNLFLIPDKGIFGASIATMISFFVMFILKLAYSKRKIYDSI
ncbi:polysaccharide biosynthesis C-terminal domain-containing protein [Flavobacteriaceae bacterium S356]|uniref:Polysaccharide biosynthesis C-terminal domain-containing protein n=1 Tax=Asprobacillus argus TaxID=3076534 RepID=A0ABU3LBL6_9FLAO|nr:polysaccharide biosynthesis C-terminal domain-containing protein [Flavobacteriaceae bacterium S356]